MHDLLLLAQKVRRHLQTCRRNIQQIQKRTIKLSGDACGIVSSESWQVFNLCDVSVNPNLCDVSVNPKSV
jgi:hypothetical protein